MIRAEWIAIGLVGAGVGYVVGRHVQRAQFEQQLREGQVLDLADVKGLLSPQQSQLVAALIDASGDVLAQRIGDTVTLLARVGGEQFETLFSVPASDGSRLTIAELRARRASSPDVIEGSTPTG
jgi:hypothetical protein